MAGFHPDARLVPSAMCSTRTTLKIQLIQQNAMISPNRKMQKIADQLAENDDYCESSEEIDSTPLHSVTDSTPGTEALKVGDRRGFLIENLFTEKPVPCCGLVHEIRGNRVLVTARANDSINLGDLGSNMWDKKRLPTQTDKLFIPWRLLRKFLSIPKPPDRSQPSPNPELPKKGDRVYVPLDGYWELVEVQRVHKNVFAGSRLTQFARETLKIPIVNGLKEWRPQPDPVYIDESAGIKDKKGWVQGWHITRIDRHI
ncbi:MAG: hypothetical protein J7519_14180 [Roseofilum sp. SID1]|nr:hypothetical protein [Roseofilum sp. SID1]